MLILDILNYNPLYCLALGLWLVTPPPTPFVVSPPVALATQEDTLPGVLA